MAAITILDTAAADIPTPVAGKTSIFVDADLLKVKTSTGTVLTMGGSVISVNADGGTTGFSFTGGPITNSGVLTMSGAVSQASGGLPTSGTAGQVLAKIDSSNYNAHWVSVVSSFNTRTGNVTLTSSDVITALGFTPGTVTTVSVISANGVSGSVATATTTPAITLTLGAITPTSVVATGTVTGSNLSGTNTGDQTWIAPRVQAASVTGTATINWANMDVTKLTLTGNTVVTNSGAVDGQKVIIQAIQGGSGSYGLTFTSETKFGTSFTTFTQTSTVGAMDMIGLVYSAVNSKYNIVSFAAGY